MIIKKLTIENYLCYYGFNTFELSKGLNIILGENGEGKTKFFEAIDWLFDGNNRELDKLVSAKKLDETDIGESFKVSVSMTVEQYGEKRIITRSFIAKKIDPDDCIALNFETKGIEENKLGERTQVDGKRLLNSVFPFQIRKYSMFKGEAELNIFKNEDALLNLINLFSEAKHYDKYSGKGAYLRKKAEKAVEDSTKLDKKKKARYNQLEWDISKLEREKEKYIVYLNSSKDEIEKLETNLQDAEKHVYNAEALKIIKERIRTIEERISKLYSMIDENYTTALFDKNWVLVNFESIQKEFNEKIAIYSKERRKLQSEYDIQKGIKEGERRAKEELLNNAVPLPLGVPSKSHMEEMLKDEICKVCNREAKKGSEPYNFMMKKLQKYLDSLVLDNDVVATDDQLFKFEYISKLEYLSRSHEDNLRKLRSIKTDIIGRFELNDARKIDIKELEEKLEKEKTEREQILGNSSIAADELSDVLKYYNAWQNDLKTQNKNQIEYQAKINSLDSELIKKRKEKDEIDTESASSFLINTRNILRDIEKIFIDTKETKFDEFIDKLQIKSNSFFKKINIDAFTGTIVFTKKNRNARTIVEVQLKEDGRVFYKPNQSLLTSMHISILFAISELASEIREENFPMIFDAPTSSFGENKTAKFLNLIYETGNQKILLIKDFLYTDKSSNKLSIKPEFNQIRKDKAFWVKLDRPFDSNNLRTINTLVITL